MSFSTLWHLGLERSLALTYISWKPRSPFRITEIEGPLLTYDQMSDNDPLSCTNSLVTIKVVINHRNIPWGPRCLHRCPGMPFGHGFGLMELFLSFPAKMHPIHYFWSKTHVLGDFAPFVCHKSTVAKSGPRMLFWHELGPTKQLLSFSHKMHSIH